MRRNTTDRSVARLAQELAALSGESVAEAIRQALSERLERERLRRGAPADLGARLLAIGAHCAGLPDLDSRTPDEIVGYDETGMWT